MLFLPRRNSLCAGMSIDPSLVASRQDVAEFYRYVSHPSAAGKPKLLVGWRKHAIGEPLIAFLQGQQHIQLNWNGGALRAVLGSDNLPKPN